uniref:Retrotransposon protein, putative, unclassified n=1 Tax=Oryza sativa subsp. japonica TaxID=39947 RepID=Q2QR61_ORYSJ|nr:retrotransposon protein, putative, unclassified [Oryza sativa Japonica Group]ABA98458.1 retrotransposon protein, putative, unclassified [Oryza sativa Japonica Group]
MPKMMGVWPTGARRGGTGGRTTPARRTERFAATFRRNRGQAGVEGDAASPREETATSADALARRPGQPEEMSTRRKVRPARATVFRRCSGEEEVMPGMRAASWSRGRWWRRRPALRGRGRGGRRRNRGGNTTGRRRGRVSGALPAKRRADRGRGGSCEAEGEDGAAGRRSGEERKAAGGGRREGRRRATAGT